MLSAISVHHYHCHDCIYILRATYVSSDRRLRCPSTIRSIFWRNLCLTLHARKDKSSDRTAHQTIVVCPCDLALLCAFIRPFAVRPHIRSLVQPFVLPFSRISIHNLMRLHYAGSSTFLSPLAGLLSSLVLRLSSFFLADVCGTFACRCSVTHAAASFANSLLRWAAVLAFRRRHHLSSASCVRGKSCVTFLCMFKRNRPTLCNCCK